MKYLLTAIYTQEYIYYINLFSEGNNHGNYPGNTMDLYTSSDKSTAEGNNDSDFQDNLIDLNTSSDENLLVKKK